MPGSIKETAMRQKRIATSIVSLFFLASLSACSGGDPSAPSPTTPPTASAEGLWTGTTTTNRTVKGLVLDDGSFWLLYSEDQNPSFITGAVHGATTIQSGSAISSSAKDFNVERPGVPVFGATLSGDYTTKQTLDGTILDQTGGKMIFTTTYDPNYEQVPDINTVAGIYTGPVAKNETAEVTVFSTGKISGKSNSVPACTFDGSFVPRKGGNAFDVTLIFGGQPTCSNGSDTVRGVAFYDTVTNKLYSAAFNDAKPNGSVFLGTRKP